MLPIFLALIILSAANECPLNPKYQSYLSSNSFALVPDVQKSEQSFSYNASYEKALPSIPLIGLSIRSFEGSRAQIIEVNITMTDISKEEFKFLVQSKSNSQWSAIKLSTLISTRDDIEMGEAAVYNPVYFKDDTFPIHYGLKEKFQENKVQVKAFISSIDVQSPSGNGYVGIKYERQDWYNERISFIFSTFEQTSVRYLKISVIIFHKYTPGLLYTHSIVEQNFVKSQITVDIPQHGINELRSYIVGPISFQISASASISIAADLDDAFVLLMGSTAQNEIIYFSVSYLIFSVVECGSCTHFPYPYQGICRNQCPEQTEEKYGRCIPKTCTKGYEINQKGQCVPSCGKNSYFSNKNCVCEKEYYMIGGRCQQCPEGTKYSYKTISCVSLCGDNAKYNPSDRKCYCDTDYYIVKVNGKLTCGQCPDGTNYDENLQQCFSDSCGRNQIKTSSGCICKNGYIKTGSSCSKCPEKSQYNPFFNTCVCEDDLVYDPLFNLCHYERNENCGKNEVVVSGRCTCRSGYNLIGGQCKACPENSYYDRQRGHCDCNAGFVLSQGKCTDGRVKCSVNEHIINGRCYCIDGHERNSLNVCVQIRCGQNEELIGNKCQCKPGYRRNSFQYCEFIKCTDAQYFNTTLNKCVSKCPSHQTYDNQSKTCVPVCPYNQRYNPYTHRCEPICPENQYWNGQYCICNTGFEIINNRCVPVCRNNEIRINGYCQCKEGYRMINNYCLPYSCPGNQIWDEKYKTCRPACGNNEVWNQLACVCKYGYERNQYYQCVLACLPNQINKGGVCVCKDGYRMLNGNCVQVQCPPGYIWDQKKQGCAIACPSNSYHNGFACVCLNGFERDLHNQCVAKCKQYEVRKNGECVCQDGYRRDTTGFCVSIICPNNQQYDTTTKSCVYKCAGNQIWNGVQCICPSGYKWDQVKCVPACKQYQKRVLGVCVCIDGYRATPSGCVIIPVQCPPGKKRNQNNVCVDICTLPNQHWVNGACLCKDGYQRDIHHNCIRGCGLNEILVGNTCQCANGYYKNSQGICVKDNSPSSCYGGAVVNQVTRQCSCILPKIWIIGKCQVINSCGPNSYWTGHGCTCVYGYYMRNGQCIPTSSYYECPDYSFFNGISCTCWPGYFPLSPNSCRRCPPNTHWNGTGCSNTGLNCAPGYRWNYKELICQPDNPLCEENEYWDGLNCRCRAGCYWINSVCSKCPSGAYYDGIQCVTSQLVKRNCPGAYQFYNGKICVCINGFFQVGEYCVTCPDDRKWNGYYCEPTVHYSLVGGKTEVKANTIEATLKKR